MQLEANAPLEEDYPCERGPKVLNPLRVYPCELKLVVQPQEQPCIYLGLHGPCACVRKEGEGAAAPHPFLSFALASTTQIPMLYDAC